MASKYEMHVYTMGTRAYAEKVCAAIDPSGQLFGGRILSRDESGSMCLRAWNLEGILTLSIGRLDSEKPAATISLRYINGRDY